MRKAAPTRSSVSDQPQSCAIAIAGAGSWRSYEELALSVISALSKELDVQDVSGPELLSGRTGTKWAIDGKAWQHGGRGFLVVEARRYPGRRLSQGRVAELAFIVEDTTASGAIIVSPLPLQSGADLVAKAHGIEHLRLEADSSTAYWVAQFLGRVFKGVGFNDSLNLTHTLVGGALESPLS